MSAAPMNWIITLVVVIIIGIIAILIVKWLLASAMIAPFAYAQEDTKQKTVDTTTIKTNDTDIHITCTSNIPDLVSCD